LEKKREVRVGAVKGDPLRPAAEGGGGSGSGYPEKRKSRILRQFTERAKIVGLA